MKDDDLDLLLGSEERILPSSGFVASVMRLVREEAAALPPISFPWKRALPLVGGSILALGWTLVALVAFSVWGLPAAPSAEPLPPAIISAIAIAKSMQVVWIVAALAATAISVKLSNWLAR